MKLPKLSRPGTPGGLMSAASRWAAQLSGEEKRPARHMPEDRRGLAPAEQADTQPQQPSVPDAAPAEPRSERADALETRGTPWYMDPSVQQVTRRVRNSEPVAPRRESEDWEVADVDRWRRRAGRPVPNTPPPAPPVSPPRPAGDREQTSPRREAAPPSRTGAPRRRRKSSPWEDLRYLLWGAAIFLGVLATAVTFILTAISF